MTLRFPKSLRKPFVCACGKETTSLEKVREHVETGECPEQGPSSSAAWIHWSQTTGHRKICPPRQPMTEETRERLREYERTHKDEIRAKRRAKAALLRRMRAAGAR